MGKNQRNTQREGGGFETTLIQLTMHVFLVLASVTSHSVQSQSPNTVCVLPLLRYSGLFFIRKNRHVLHGEPQSREIHPPSSISAEHRQPGGGGFTAPGSEETSQPGSDSCRIHWPAGQPDSDSSLHTPLRRDARSLSAPHRACQPRPLWQVGGDKRRGKTTPTVCCRAVCVPFVVCELRVNHTLTRLSKEDLRR